MYESVTYEVLLNRMLGRVSSALDKREGAVIYDTQSPTAIELQLLYMELDQLISDSYGDTASREFLIRLCKDRGILPEEATCAVLQGVFTPATLGAAALIGQRFNLDSLNYVVTAAIDENAGTYQVTCETAGISGNQHLGYILPIEYIDGLETAQLTSVLIPGEDEEETEALRTRYLESFNEQAFGGNVADYLAKVRAIAGVGDVKVTRSWNGDISPSAMIPTAAVTTWYNGLSVSGEVKDWIDTVYTAALAKKLTVGGTVLVTIVDSDDYGPASSTLVNNVQIALDPEQNAGEGLGIAPIGHVVNVQSAEAVTISVTTTATFEDGYSWTNLGTAITNAVDSYLADLREGWACAGYLVVRISHIESAILGITGVADVSGTKINGAAANLSLTAYQVPVIGGVSP
mgnify:CR=1 FL=1